MMLPKPQRRALARLKVHRQAKEVITLRKRIRDSHTRWSALARYPGNPSRAVLLYFWERNGHPVIL